MARHRVKLLLVRIGLVVAALLLAFALLELVLRLGFGDTLVRFPRYHSDAWYGEFHLRRLRPNTVFWHSSRDGAWKFTTNAQGFRDVRNWLYEKETGTTRILCLGDSHDEGFEVDQDSTLSAVLERYLNARGMRAEVFNMGVSGYSTAEELALLENEGVRYHPDYVVVAFFANDYEDNVRAGLYALGDSGLVLRRKEYVPGVGVLNFLNRFRVLRKLSENSYAYSMLLNLAWDWFKSGSKLHAEGSDAPPESAKAWQTTHTAAESALAARLVEEMHTVCRRSGCRLIVVDVPEAGENEFHSSVDTGLRAAIRAHSDAYLDSEELLGPYRGKALVHVPHGQFHISAFTHQAIAEEIGRRILAEQPKSR